MFLVAIVICFAISYVVMLIIELAYGDRGPGQSLMRSLLMKVFNPFMDDLVYEGCPERSTM